MKASNIANIILIILCVVYSLILASKLPGKCKCTEAVKPDGSTLIRMHAENDSLLKSNQALDIRIRQYQLQSDSLRQKLSGTKQTIDQLKQQQHENITRMDNLNSSELYSYFSKFNP